MKNILFLTGFYYPKYSVNGLCSNAIINELKTKYNLYVLSYKNNGEKAFYKYENESIYKVRPRLFFLIRELSEMNNNYVLKNILYFVAMFIQKMKRVLFFFFYPFDSIFATWRYVRYADSIVKNNKIDCVVSVFQPFETLVAADYLKKKYNIKEIIYVLDTLSNVNKKKNFWNNYKRRRGMKTEKRYYSKADMIINMRCHEKELKNSYYNSIRNKFVFSDIPLFRKLEKPKYRNMFSSDYINFVYTGTLDKERRDPTKICKLIDEYNKNNSKKIKCHFFSRGDCENILKRFNCVVAHGFVKNDTSICALFEADVLISLEVKNSDMISAKIFEYISTGKKIIHFYETNNDVLLPYLNNYDNSLIININNNVNSNIELINSFIKKNIKNNLNLDKDFIENTPGYTADLISDFLGGDSNDRF